MLLNKFSLHNKNEFSLFLKQFIKFGLVGISNTVVSLLVYYLVLWLNSDYYIWGCVLGTGLGIANSFFLNDKFVFKSSQNDVKSVLGRLLKTYVSYGGISFLSFVLLWLEVNLCEMDKISAPIINLFITTPLNFLINKFWTFNK